MASYPVALLENLLTSLTTAEKPCHGHASLVAFRRGPSACTSDVVRHTSTQYNSILWSWYAVLWQDRPQTGLPFIFFWPWFLFWSCSFDLVVSVL